MEREDVEALIYLTLLKILFVIGCIALFMWLGYNIGKYS